MKSIIANDQITATTVRLVDAENDVNTVMTVEAALTYAYNKDLDLIQISDQDVPVVKVSDLNKYKYELQQNEKESKKKQRSSTTQTKEVQFTYNTQEHDLAVKLRNAQRFLSDGKQVRIVMKMVGRNPALHAKNQEYVATFVNRLGDNVDFVQNIMIQGNNVICTVKVK